MTLPCVQESSLKKRISQEREILEGTTKYLRAQVALQSAFSAEPSKSSETKEASSEELTAPQQQDSEQQKDDPPSSAASGPD